MEVLTASRLRCWRECPRQHHYRYDLGYRPVEDAHALRFGTLVHAALEAWWRSNGSYCAAMRILHRAEADPADRARAEAMITAYHARWHHTVGDYEVLGVEAEWRMRLRNPVTGHPSRTWKLAGKLDALVRDRRTG